MKQFAKCHWLFGVAMVSLCACETRLDPQGVSGDASEPDGRVDEAGRSDANGERVRDASGGDAPYISTGDAGAADADVNPGLTFGYPVYTKTEIAAWSATSSEYNELAGSWAGNVDRAIYGDYGDQISQVERDIFRDEAVYIKVQAVLWAADGNSARRDKVVTMLNNLRSVTSFEDDAKKQHRLVAGWACTNLAQAAAIIDYQDPAFKSFLVNTAYPILDWTGAGNWVASFSDSKLAIAAYLGDQALWSDAKDYFYEHLRQSVYHRAYDGETIEPQYKEGGAVNLTATLGTWGASFDYPQVGEDLKPVPGLYFPNGTYNERTRDMSHGQMGLGAFMHAARTILAQNDTLEQHAYDRLLAAFTHQGERAMAYLTTGTIPEPVPTRGDGGEAFKQAWFGARKLFGANTPQVVHDMCARPEVTGYAAAGANHMVAEPFADK